MIKNILTAFLIAGLIFPTQVFANPPTPPEPTAATAEPSLVLPPRLRLRMPELSYSLLRTGQTLTATTDTILMTPETFARITIEFDSMQDQHSLYLEQQLRLAAAHSTLELGLLRSQNSYLEGELARTNQLLVTSQEIRNRDLTPLWVTLGFIGGALATIGIVYAIGPAID